MAESEMELGRLARRVVRRARPLLLVTILAVSLGVVASGLFGATRYASTASVAIIGGVGADIVGTQIPSELPDRDLASQAQLIESDAFLGPVLRELPAGSLPASVDVTAIRDTDVLRVSVASPTRVGAQVAADAIVESYVARRAQREREAYERRAFALEAQAIQLPPSGDPGVDAGRSELFERAAEYRAEAASRVGDAVVLERASVAGGPLGPTPLANGLLCGVVVGMAGLMVAVAAPSRNRVVRSRDDLDDLDDPAVQVLGVEGRRRGMPWSESDAMLSIAAVLLARQGGEGRPFTTAIVGGNDASNGGVASAVAYQVEELGVDVVVKHVQTRSGAPMALSRARGQESVPLGREGDAGVAPGEVAAVVEELPSETRVLLLECVGVMEAMTVASYLDSAVVVAACGATRVSDVRASVSALSVAGVEHIVAVALPEWPGERADHPEASNGGSRRAGSTGRDDDDVAPSARQIATAPLAPPSGGRRRNVRAIIARGGG